MNMFITLCAMMLIASGVTTAHGKSVTFYADGAIVDLEATAFKGVLEVPLPSGIIEGSLRVRPDSGTTIQRIDIMPATLASGKTEKELDALYEQKNRLGDRLQALATREEIFTSAAKSQSGKAPRKTKANPDPMRSIRKGTEFAIAQLETVYTARRKTEQEISRIDSLIATAQKNNRGAKTVARIIVSPPRGKIRAQYVVADQGWTPRYDIYLNGSGNAKVDLSGQFPETFEGFQLLASPAALAGSATAKVFPVQPGPVASLASYRLAVADEFFGAGLLSSFSFELKNLESVHLPAGDANVYHNGEYVGRLRFEGLSSGRSRRLSVKR
ncbi:MAG: hypothetical protein M0T70_16270 [Geobacteraceae bacterium]|nr:hypothetical protein [Geobacteraceae bacterium]